MKYIDLHMHTIHSDGTCNPGQNIIDAAMLGMNVIAITDHDSTNGYKEAKEESKNWGVDVLTGVEISVKDYHILGYNFDIEDNRLQEFLTYSRKLQESVVKKRVEILQGADIPITFEKVRQYSPGSRLGKLNIITAMMKDRDCREYLGHPSSGELFDKYLKKGRLAAIIEYQEELKAEEAIDAIHHAGGLAVLAHPFKDIKVIEELDQLMETGIDGLEAQPNYNGKNEMFIKYAEEKGLLITYGSDYHGARFQHRPLLNRNGNLVDLPF
ncbi:PHP domain-containing protein [Candidatus Woesearchaeota archaeon]|nr:PHP domain-containing protein [Candidatus Woesearchaeota archaeon]